MRNSKHLGSSSRSSGRIVAPCDSGKLAAEIMRERDLGKPTSRRRAGLARETDPARAADNRTPGESRPPGLERENAGLRMGGGDVLRRAAAMSLADLPARTPPSMNSLFGLERCFPFDLDISNLLPARRLDEREATLEQGSLAGCCPQG